MTTAFLILGVVLFVIVLVIVLIAALVSVIHNKKEREKDEEEQLKIPHHKKESQQEINEEEQLEIPHYKKESQQEIAGEEGEQVVASRCEEICKEYEGGLFNSFCFCDSRGYSSEIDHIVITLGGIFIIETKNWSGIIEGNPSDETWLQTKPNVDQQKEVKNPILQNEKHIQHLKHRFQTNPPKRTSRIVFSGSVTLEVDDNRLFTVQSAQDFIQQKTEEAHYSRQYVERIYNQLQDILNHYGITKEEHLKNIQERNRYQ